MFVGAAEKRGQHDHGDQLREQHKNINNSVQTSSGSTFSGSQHADHAAKKQRQNAAGYADQKCFPGAVD